MRRPPGLRLVGTVDGEDVYKPSRPVYGKRFGSAFPDDLLELVGGLTKNDLCVLIAIWAKTNRGNVCVTSISELAGLLLAKGNRIETNHISSHVGKLERAGALRVVKSGKGGIEIEVNKKYFWNGNVREYHEKIDNYNTNTQSSASPLQADIRRDERNGSEMTRAATTSLYKERKAEMIEEIFLDGKVVARFTRPTITSVPTAYEETLAYLVKNPNYRIPMKANGRRDRSRIDFCIAQHLAELGMSKSAVRQALIYGSEKARRQPVNGVNYVIRTVEQAFRSLGL